MNKLHDIVVYTALFGGYDTIAPVDPSWNCDFVCFTDNSDFIAEGWQIEVVPCNNESFATLNRRYKMLPHEYLGQYKRSLYIDANIKLIQDPTPLLNKYLDDGIIALPVHPDRYCLYDEGLACIEHGKADKESVLQLLYRYKEISFPEKFGLTENNVVLRRHLDETVVSLMNEWWMEYCNGVKRDQLILPYLIWKNKISFLELREGPRISNRYFKINLHNRDLKKSFIRKMIQRSIIEKDVSIGSLIIATVALRLIYIKKVFIKWLG
jgi:hypothetical protein